MTTLYFSLFSYGLLLFSLIALPERFWDFLLCLFSRGKVFFIQKKKSLPVLGEIYLGEDLLLVLQAMESKIALGIKILPTEIIRYKFYTDLLEQLFEAHRRLGIGIRKFVPEIRKAIIRDLQFEKKIFSECMSGILQFLVIAMTTWAFVFLTSIMVEIHPHKTIFMLMSALQLMGVFAFFQLLSVMKRKTFAKFSEAISELYLFSTLMEVGLPLNEILARSKVLSGHLMRHKLFSHEAIRTKKLIERLKETGLSPKEETQEIVGSIWNLQEESFHKFTKKVQALKFIVMAFFFLPAYFLYLYSIFKFFMEQ